ncbi:uncharacterized protein PHALS_07607 [Plasmopara halstedii]|uniref:Uncharacterized protein n=1 Tax=Plasmopara halstedii TaxID=4781 RepID=A0A0P1B6F0_PLAHL|nr:uncharacterized protein PHALS_07607 [Plasmopara halstedii]CEG49868.1 hypothetical protein PHALS_07607 [Plasmopara halstedii]|eukprot:XP_024586237.1 hypothetical protein PHALS_07607 [Plasmopara halstedii]
MFHLLSLNSIIFLVILLKVVTWTMLEKVLATFLVCETNERNAIVVLSHVS